ncbi:Protein kinase, ATP binding site-containing protein [Cynara cardunculus var. scolymus]|uniref:Protein kinase, ATP binding site-containing protein n=1 Tax=Cynara cardunculus var. scolymus TaxID=59895 RepID=A0A103XZ72_CYNCS|nr:Protein kinase, ATP binding site-containing protein [Cynara cardunculus var. scolymus]
MGCAPTKPFMDSSHPVGLEKLKMENGYVRKSSSSSSSGGRSNRKEGKKTVEGEGGGRPSVSHDLVDGWPKWLTDNVPKDALDGLLPKSADAYDKLDKKNQKNVLVTPHFSIVLQVGSGTYSNVYKARDRKTKKIVALKKVRFDTSEPESIKFMAREIMMLRKLDHPNIVKLQGLATSRMQYSLYLVFDYMQTDLSRIISRPDERLTEPQGSNLLIDKNGMLKIADFGLANYYNPNKPVALTNRVVTLWYRSPELLLGATRYGPGIDLWSAGCLLAEMFAGRPIMPGRTEVEQLHKIFKLCGTPSEDYWKKLKLSTTFRPPHSYKPNLQEAFRDYPRSALGLLTVLLALDPAYRGSAASALQKEFFHTSPWACDLTGLPVIQVDDDDLDQTSERKKPRKPRTRQRSRMPREQRRKDQTTENPDVASVSPKEEAETKPEVDRKSEELVTTKTSSSSSPGTGPRPTLEIPAPLPSPENLYQRYQRQMSESHPNARMNIKNRPPLPGAKRISSKYGGMVDEAQTHLPRSSSTREFRKIDQRKLDD